MLGAAVGRHAPVAAARLASCGGGAACPSEERAGRRPASPRSAGRLVADKPKVAQAGWLGKRDASGSAGAWARVGRWAAGFFEPAGWGGGGPRVGLPAALRGAARPAGPRPSPCERKAFTATAHATLISPLCLPYEAAAHTSNFPFPTPAGQKTVAAPLNISQKYRCSCGVKTTQTDVSQSVLKDENSQPSLIRLSLKSFPVLLSCRLLRV